MATLDSYDCRADLRRLGADATLSRQANPARQDVTVNVDAAEEKNYALSCPAATPLNAPLTPNSMRD